MRVALITIPRSGSSFYSRVLAKQYKVKHVGELFTEAKQPSIDDSLRIWSHGNCCAKIFTRDFIHMPRARESLEYYENLVYGTADKIVYLYRKNKIDHLKSMITADTTSNWAPYREYKEHIIDVTKDKMFEQLRRIELDITRLDQVRNRFPGEVIYYEDFATEDKKYKYKSTFICEGKELPEDLGLNL
jgi:hypothetical protein